MATEAFEIAALVDPFKSDLPVGVEIPAVSAVGWVNGQQNVDIRPRLVDKSSGEARLLDSGAQISATKPRPGDTIDNSVNLVAVNGSRIQTYGQREIVFKINRKTYSITAVICDVNQDILGMDFVNKYKLGLEWDDFDQSTLFLVDKRANIKSELKIVTVPTNLTRAHHLEPVSSLSASRLPVRSFEENFPPPSSPQDAPVAPLPVRDAQAVQFEVSCIKKLGEAESPENLKKKEDALAIHDLEYQKMIKKHPQLLNPSFSKAKPVHNVYHRIDTADHSPCKAKRRPILANSAKENKNWWRRPTCCQRRQEANIWPNPPRKFFLVGSVGCGQVRQDLFLGGGG